MGYESSKVSVCIPAYNEEAHILQCLRSVSKQSDIDITEILVGVNSSTDRTRQIAEEYSLTDRRVKIIDSPKGKASAWNALNAAAENNLRFFQDGDCFAPSNAYSRLLNKIQDDCIICASFKRDIRDKGLIVRMLNFPRRYIAPFEVIKGNLYLMDHKKVSRRMKERTGSADMPPDTVNEDVFLTLVCDKIKISREVFVLIKVAGSLNDEIKRQRRMYYGDAMLRRKYPSFYKEYLKRRGGTSKAAHILRLFKLAEPMEKIFFLFVMPVKYLFFAYIFYQVKKTDLEKGVEWK